MESFTEDSMADDDHTFESADAGASHTYPMQALSRILGRGVCPKKRSSRRMGGKGPF